MRRWLIAVWLLVGLSTVAVLLVAATTGGVRAQEVPIQYEYRVTTNFELDPKQTTTGVSAALNQASAEGWQLMETQMMQTAWRCGGTSGNYVNPATLATAECRQDSTWYFVLRRPRP